MPKTVTQGERMVVIEIDIKYIKKEIVKNGTKLDDFIKCADDKYAHKEEFDEFKKTVNKQKDINRGWVQWVFPSIIAVVALIIALV